MMQGWTLSGLQHTFFLLNSLGTSLAIDGFREIIFDIIFCFLKAISFRMKSQIKGLEDVFHLLLYSSFLNIPQLGQQRLVQHADKKLKVLQRLGQHASCQRLILGLSTHIDIYRTYQFPLAVVEFSYCRRDQKKLTFHKHQSISQCRLQITCFYIFDIFMIEL